MKIVDVMVPTTLECEFHGIFGHVGGIFVGFGESGRLLLHDGA